MLVRYRLTPEARKRQFYEGMQPSTNQLVEMDASHMDRAALKRLSDVGIVVQPATATTQVIIEIPGEYDAITVEELVQRLHDEATGSHRRAKDSAMYQVPPPRNY